MFGNVLRSKKESPQPVSVDDSRIRLLHFHNKRYVVGLEWETIKAQRNLMKEIRRIGRKRNLDVVAIRKSDSIQAGFAPKTKHKLRGGYSLVVTLASLLDGCCIAVVPIGCDENGVREFTLVGRTEKGGIHPNSDEIYTESNIHQTVVDLRDALRGSKREMNVPIYGDPDMFPWVTDALDLESILHPSHIQKDFMLRPLTWGMTKKQIYVLSAVVLMSFLLLYFVIDHLGEQEVQRQLQIERNIIKQEEINKKARYQAALDKLKHPWVTKPSVSNFLLACKEKGIGVLSLSIKGWIPAIVHCEDSGFVANYVRPEYSAVTTKEFVDAVREEFGVGVDFNFTQTSMAAFSVQFESTPNGDDPMLSMEAQLLKLISIFQKVNIPASFTSIAIKDVEKNEQGEDLPRQDWQEYSFNVETEIPPELIFIRDDFQGVRINSITYTVNNDKGNISYKIAGSVYGKR